MDPYLDDAGFVSAAVEGVRLDLSDSYQSFDFVSSKGVFAHVAAHILPY